jgi:hypothetical protein
VPGFVANRVGTQTMNDIMYRAEQHKLSIVDVDALTLRADSICDKARHIIDDNDTFT